MPADSAPATVLVTGAGGFLGLALARQLRARGLTVRSVSRGDYPELAGLGIEHQRGDLADPGVAERACAGCRAVFHVAAKAGIWGRHAEFVRANVVATERLLAAARAAGVREFVHTSSPSVVFDGRDHDGADEHLPYPTRFLNSYSATKATAEQAVRAANSTTLATVALRPHLIVGPNDPHMLPRLIARARRRQLFQVGPGTNRVSMTDVADAAAAHLMAWDRLCEGGHSAVCAGRAYFITQGEAVNLWGWIGDMLVRLKLPPISRQLSFAFAYRVGAVLEAVYGGLGRTAEPRMTRFLATQLATTHVYSIAAATRDFGYRPARTMDAVTDTVAAWAAGLVP